MSSPVSHRRVGRRRLFVGAAAAGAGAILVACGQAATAVPTLPPQPTVTTQPSGTTAAATSTQPAAAATQLERYPISEDVFTTIEKTVVPDPVPSGADVSLLTQVSKYSENGLGTWQYGAGLAAEKRLDLMPSTYSAASATSVARLLHFFAITDIHITDKESPSQPIYLGGLHNVSSAYSPVMLYTTHVLDAAIQTVNAVHRQKPIDFGISLGDTCNSTQYNELRWYVDVIDGKDIRPDSGAKDDPTPGPRNDYQDDYKATGLDSAIPWYQTLGNHDHFWTGSLVVDDYLRSSYVGEDVLNLGDIFTDPLGADSRGFYMGYLDGRTPYGDITGAGPVGDFAEPPKVPAADPDRRSLTRKEWIAEFFQTSSSPAGHGFSQANVDSGFACYSFEPRPDVPIKVIVLDDTHGEDDPDDGGYGHGTLDEERYNWLIAELDKGQADGKLMIIAAHAPFGVEPAGSPVGWWSRAFVSEATLIERLHTYPNFVLWIAGHRHTNAVTAFVSPDDTRPELGFWQVETSSLRDFPQQFRTFEIVRNSDATVSVFITNVDTAVTDGSPAAISRSYGVAAQQLYKNPLPLLPTGSYNAELLVQPSSEMQAKLQDVGTPMQA